MDSPTNAASLGQFALPAAMRQQAEAEKVKQVNTEFQKTIATQAAYVHPNDRGIFNAFAQLGHAVGQAVNKGTPLDPQDEVRLQIMEKSNAKIQELRQTEGWAQLEPGEKALRTQEAVARAALDAGDIQTFSQVSKQIQEQRSAQAKAAQLARKAGIDVENAELTRDGKRTANANAITEGVNKKLRGKKLRQEIKIAGEKHEERAQGNTFFVQGEDGMYKPVTGKLMPDGSLSGLDGQMYAGALSGTEMEQLTESNKRLTDSEEEPARDDILSEPELKRLDAFRKNIDKDERVAEANAVRDQLTIGVQIGEALIDSIEQGDSAEAIGGTAGSIAIFADNVSSAVKGVFGTMTKSYQGVATELDGETLGYGERGLSEYAERTGILDQFVPKTVVNANKIKSNIVALSYAVARSNEEGGRFSDQDIQRVMTQIGANYSNPKALAGTLSQLLTNKSAQKMHNKARLGGIDKMLGLGGKGMRLVYGTEETQASDAALAGQFSEVMKKLGTAGTPEGDAAIRRDAVTPEQEATRESAQSLIDGIGNESILDEF